MSHAVWVMRGARAVPQCARLGTFACSSSLWASFASAARDEAAAASQPSTSGQRDYISSKDLTASSIGSYYALNPTLLPEASRAYANAFYAPRDPGNERRGGCKALQQEVEASGAHAVMYRPAMHTLCEAVGGPDHKRLLLSGPAGSGKSVALAGLVEWARQRGWLVLYVPSCLALVRGGYFSRREGTNQWDTLTAAQQLLKGVMDAHGRELKKLPLLSARAEEAAAAATTAEEVAAVAAAPEVEVVGRTVYDMVTEALALDDNGPLVVDTALRLVRQMAAVSVVGRPDGSAVPVLFALDDYNCLYGTTEYGAHPPPAAEGEGPRRTRRRVLRADELVLASGMRLLGAGRLGAARVVAATTAVPPLPAPASLAPSAEYTEVSVPGFTEVETRNALAHYHATGYASALATSRQARQLFALTQGNARELRIQAASVGIHLS